VSAQAAALPEWLDLLAMCVMGAVGAAIARRRGAAIARRRGAAIYGTLFAGIVVGLGGGMVRDVLLNTRPVAIANWIYIPAVLGAALIGALVYRKMCTSQPVFVFIQGLSLGLLVVIGCQRALDFDVPVPSVVLLGILTASAGGIILDPLSAGRGVAISSTTGWLGTALLISGVVFWLLSDYVSFTVASVVCVALVTILRVLTVERGWPAPEWPAAPTRSEQT